MRSTYKEIFVTFQKAGIHYYPQAKDEPSLADVSYLGSPHRHLFKFKVTIEVFHNDRELEFHQLLNWCESLYQDKVLELNGKSCEMIAEDLIDAIIGRWDEQGSRKITVEVSEDGECGAVVYCPSHF